MGPLATDPSSDPILTGQGPVKEPASSSKHLEGGPGGYHGWAIRQAGSLMTEEAIEADLEVDEEIELSREESYYADHIKPILAMTNWRLWIKKTEQYAAQEKRISELHDQNIMMEQLGLSSPVVDLEIEMASAASANAKQQAAAVMRDDSTQSMRVSSREFPKALAEVRRLEAITIHEQAETEKQFNDLTKHRWLQEAKADLASLRSFIASLIAVRDSGADFPKSDFDRFIQSRRDRWGTGDGRFYRYTNLQAETQGIIAAGENLLALGSRAVSNVAYWGGAGLTWMYGEPWFATLGSRAYNGLQGFSRELTQDSQIRTARAVAVMGETYVMVLQIATESADHVCDPPGPLLLPVACLVPRRSRDAWDSRSAKRQTLAGPHSPSGPTSGSRAETVLAQPEKRS